MVTHDPAYASVATRTVSLFDGRITVYGNSPRFLA
jgi:ABC-type lipoprotein export system ATPase subunit